MTLPLSEYVIETIAESPDLSGGGDAPRGRMTDTVARSQIMR